MNWIQNIMLFLVGYILLILSKIKVIVGGYKDPRTFSASDIDRVIEYNFSVIDRWLAYLKKHSGDSDISGKQILELGPGSDLGIGITLLALGAKKYNACDVNPLLRQTPMKFYERLFKRLKEDRYEVAEIENHLTLFVKNEESNLNYVVNPDFDLQKNFEEKSIDLVFSQAAFEHFDDVNDTISGLSWVSKKGASLVALVDLQAHSRWVRDKDPNNIYRFPKWLYRLAWYKGIPNRIRPFEYEKILASNGWGNINISSLKSEEGGDMVNRGLNKDFQGKENEMNILTIMITATKI